MVLPNFKENLEKYAKLLVANGINVQPGHTVALSIDVEQAELAHLLVKEASKRFLPIKKLKWNIC